MFSFPRWKLKSLWEGTKFLKLFCTLHFDGRLTVFPGEFIEEKLLANGGGSLFVCFFFVFCLGLVLRSQGLSTDSLKYRIPRIFLTFPTLAVSPLCSPGSLWTCDAQARSTRWLRLQACTTGLDIHDLGSSWEGITFTLTCNIRAKI